MAEIAGLSLRDEEALDIIRYVAEGRLVYPLGLIERKGWAGREA